MPDGTRRTELGGEPVQHSAATSGNEKPKADWGKRGVITAWIIALPTFWLMALSVPKEGWEKNRSIFQALSGFVERWHLNWWVTAAFIIKVFPTLLRGLVIMWRSFRNRNVQPIASTQGSENDGALANLSEAEQGILIMALRNRGEFFFQHSTGQNRVFDKQSWTALERPALMLKVDAEMMTLRAKGLIERQSKSTGSTQTDLYQLTPEGILRATMVENARKELRPTGLGNSTCPACMGSGMESLQPQQATPCRFCLGGMS